MNNIPPDSVAPGQTGHIAAHNAISDVLTAHDAQLQGIPPLYTGTATLVAGSVAVALPAAEADSVVFVSRMTPVGAPGYLSVTVSPGIGFTISSSSPSEASLIGYLVLS